jgi:hypothetical protein
MNRINRRGRLLALLTPLAVLLLLFLLPPERTLGEVIKLVLLHGALVRAALIAFAVAGGLGLFCLLSANPIWPRWAIAIQITALLLWIGNVLSSSLATKLTWGEWIAWGEPRVLATIHVLWLALACLALVLWLDHRIFTGLANLVVAGFSWGLIKGATLVRHPFDPLGSSNSSTYQLLYGGMVVVLLVIGWQVARWMVARGWSTNGGSANPA